MAGLALVGLFNAVVDPYGITRWFDRSGINAYKPALQTRVRLVKASEVRRLRPDAIVLGTSRSHLGLRMSHPGWPPGTRYNLAFDGATTKEMYSYLRHAHAAHPLKLVVLGLDTWHIEGNPSAVRPDFDPSILLRPHAPWTRATTFLAETRLLLNWDTFGAAVHTLRSQDQATPSWLAPDGQRLGPVFFHRPGEPFMAGPARYFLDVDRQEIGFKLPALPSSAGRPAAPRPTRREPDSFDYIAKIVAFCREEGIGLRIFITPAHAHQMEISDLMGETPAIERGKRQLVQLLAEDARGHSAAPFALWDFSGYSSVTIEPLPAVGDRREMTFYWDSSHFKETVGDWVLDRLFSTARPSHSPRSDFGRPLTPATIEVELAEIRAGHERYARDHPQDVAALRAMLAEARAEQRRGAKP